MNTCYDTIGIFLCIQIIYRYQALASKRGCPILNEFYESILTILWSRFELLMKNHINSIAEIDTSRLSSIDVRPHYVS
jgi:vacuolar protein sorting-associated protein 52